jgi:uncharacterized delta-60 repeat protein
LSAQRAHSVIQQTDGKLVAAGTAQIASKYRFALVRYNTDGSLDNSFDNDGKLDTIVDANVNTAYSVIQQADGKLVVAGESYDGSVRKFVLVRYSNDGSLDAAFDGDGKITLTVGVTSKARSVIQQTDGKILAAGESDGNFLLVRFNEDGSLDTSFDGDGILTTNVGSISSVISLFQQNNGGIVAAGAALVSNTRMLALVRYNTDGSLDATFDGDGKLTTAVIADSYYNSVIQQTDGKFIAAGFSNNHLSLARYNLNGSADVTFDKDGIVTIDFGGNNDRALSVVQQSDGKLVTAGYSYDAGNTVFVLARFDSGQLDSDSDSIFDSRDNCPFISNILQEDTDNDGVGNSCDDLSTDAAESVDTDHDGIGNNADPDDDNDGVIDSIDIFPLDISETSDLDNDNIGDNSDPLPNNSGTLNNHFAEKLNDHAGISVAFAGDVNKDGYGDYVIGFPDYDIPAETGRRKIVNAGRAEVISGKSGTILMFVNGANKNDAMGYSVVGNSDLDGDGYNDVVVGAPKSDNASKKLINSGTATVLYGPDGLHQEVIFGMEEKALFGAAVALANTNIERLPEIIVGAPKGDDPTNNLKDAGSVSVFSAGDLLHPIQTYYGSTKKSNFGASIATGEVDTIAGKDIIIGAPNDSHYATETYYLKNTGSIAVYNISNTQTPVMKHYGIRPNALLGTSVASGDLDKDGKHDVIAGAPGGDTNVLNDPIGGSVTVFFADATPSVTKYGATAKAGLGNSVAAGDVNGDGYADIIAGSSKDDAPTMPKAIKDTGSVSVFSGNGYAPIGSTLYGSVAKDYFGFSVSSGDINSDGKDDLIIGIPGFDLPATQTSKIIRDAGAVHIVSGASL